MRPAFSGRGFDKDPAAGQGSLSGQSKAETQELFTASTTSCNPCLASEKSIMVLSVS